MNLKSIMLAALFTSGALCASAKTIITPPYQAMQCKHASILSTMV